MLIISVRASENNRLKRNANRKRKNKDKKERGETEAWVKGWATVHLS